MSVSALLRERVRRPSYLKKLAKAEDLLHHFPNGAYIGWSGFTGVGYPKYAYRISSSLGDPQDAFPAPRIKLHPHTQPSLSPVFAQPSSARPRLRCPGLSPSSRITY